MSQLPVKDYSALFNVSGPDFNGVPQYLSWTPGTVYYAFADTANSNAGADRAASFSPFDAAEQAATQTALSDIQQLLSNIQFVHVSPSQIIGSGDGILFANGVLPNNNAVVTTTRATGPNTTALATADVYVHPPALSNDDYTPGGLNYLALLAGAEYALGLHDPTPNANGSGRVLDPAYDTYPHTLLAPGGNGMAAPSTPALFDLQALQTLYGASKNGTGTGTGAVYGFDATFSASNHPEFNFALTPDTVVTIDDPTGAATLDLSGYHTTDIVSLAAGSINEVDGILNTLILVGSSATPAFLGAPVTANTAIGTVWAGDGMETISAAGTLKPVVIFGGSGINILTGGGPAATLIGGSGRNTLKGGSGQAFILAGSTLGDLLTGGKGSSVVIGGAGPDTLVSQDVTSTVAAPSTSLLMGGGGDDSLSAGAGADVLDGGAGSNTLIGGPGSTTFAELAGPGADTIQRFHTTRDQLLIDSGANPVSVQSIGTPSIVWGDAKGDLTIWSTPGGAYNGYASFTSPGANAKLIGAADFNGNGGTDFLFRNSSTGVTQISLADAANQRIGTVVLPSQALSYGLGGIADFSGLGHSDLLWHNPTSGGNALWFLDSFGNYASYAKLPTQDARYQLVGLGDYGQLASKFSGNRGVGLFWRNPVSGANALWFVKNGAYDGYTTLPNQSPSYSFAGVGDFNGDGSPDILWRNAATGANVVWLLDAGGRYTGFVALPKQQAAFSVAGVQDFNGDGTADIYWADKSGHSGVWLMHNGAVAGFSVLPTQQGLFASQVVPILQNISATRLSFAGRSATLENVTSIAAVGSAVSSDPTTVAAVKAAEAAALATAANFTQQIAAHAAQSAAFSAAAASSAHAQTQLIAPATRS